MKKISKIVALLLTAALLLSCMAGCAYKAKDGAVAEIDGAGVSEDVYKYFLYSMINSLESNYNTKVADIQDQQATDSMTFKQYIEAYALSSAERMTKVTSYFSELGLVWTDEKQAELDADIEEAFAENTSGRDELMQVLDSIGLSYDSYKEIIRTDYEYDMIVDKLYGDNGQSPVSQETANESFKTNYARVLNILIPTVDLSTGEALSDEDIAAAQATYGEAMAKVDALEDNDETGFRELLSQYNEDTGMDSYPDGYMVADDGTYVEEFTEASFSVDPGQYTSCESDYGYHIIMRLETRDEDIITEFGSNEEYLTSYRSSLFSSDLERMVEEAMIEYDQKALDKLFDEMIKSIG